MITINQETKTSLILLLGSTNNDFNRICIADFEIEGETVTLYLEDKYDFKNSLDECVKVEFPTSEFAKFIKDNGLNAYEGVKQREGGSLYNDLIEIAEPIDFYQQDASAWEQKNIREDLVKAIAKQVIDEV